jgi:hypothetical protein
MLPSSGHCSESVIEKVQDDSFHLFTNFMNLIFSKWDYEAGQNERGLLTGCRLRGFFFFSFSSPFLGAILATSI